ncbi:hypothetical protein [Paenibacillus cymbidii]|uniref:hypothetical protein n=1 Tax=Paenibacillus cymbidii TaxID=1639034 RepID=UPI001080C7F8|nr:hypothetical protein [Paenibacillus cymbidii]
MKMVALLLALLIAASGFVADGVERYGAGSAKVTPSAAESILTKPPADSGLSSWMGFKLEVFSDKTVYRADEPIRLKAELVYEGAADEITIWHGLPYVTISIVQQDGDFKAEGTIATLLTSTKLKKDAVVEIPYVKSGGYSNNDRNAQEMRRFFADPDVKLQPGVYKVTAETQFSLDSKVIGSEVKMAPFLIIKVVR